MINALFISTLVYMLLLCLLLSSKLKKLKKENRRLMMLFNGSRYGFSIEKKFNLHECTVSQTFEGRYNSFNHVRDFCDIITSEFLDVMKQRIKQPLFDAIFKNFVSEFKKANNVYKCVKVVVKIPYVMFEEKNMEVKIYE
jgi:hypothetical protein